MKKSKEYVRMQEEREFWRKGRKLKLFPKVSMPKGWR